MKYLKSIFLCLAVLSAVTLFGQDNTKEIHLAKGDVLDILLLRNNPGGDAHFENYKKTAFPVAMKHTYQPLPGFSVKKTLFGNLLPQALILGKWNSKKQREDFIAVADSEIPNFHGMRKDIWTFFYVTYYELDRDISIKIDRSKYLVATAYWGEKEQEVATLVDKAENKMSKRNGQSILRLEHGSSPFGYLYSPTQFIITAWPSKESYQSYQQSTGNYDESILTNVQQFELN